MEMSIYYPIFLSNLETERLMTRTLFSRSLSGYELRAWRKATKRRHESDGVRKEFHDLQLLMQLKALFYFYMIVLALVHRMMVCDCTHACK